MGRIIGLIGCTCLVIVALRLTNLQYSDHTLKGGEDRAASRVKLAPREHYKLGKELYLRGRYQDSVQHLAAATGTSTGLTAVERRQVEDYLDRARTRLQAVASGATVRGQSDPPWETGAEAAAGSDMPAHLADATRNRVDKLMKQANAALKRGDRVEAVNLAQLANQIAKEARVPFAKGEATPGEFLAKLHAPSRATRSTSASDWTGDDLNVRTTSQGSSQRGAIQQTAAEEEFADTGEASPSAVQTAASSSRRLSTQDQAAALIAQAREDLKAGNYDEARHKAFLAEKLDVTYDLFDDRPELVLADVDRLSGSTTLARNNSEPKAASPAVATEINSPREAKDPAAQTVSATPAATNSQKQQAVRLLELARLDLKNGNLAGAQAKAEEAEKLSVAYKLFEDMPELVLNDVAARLAAEGVAQGSDSPAEMPKAGTSPAAKPQALALLAKARQALSEERIDEARQLAIEAERLKAPYDLFDDRPDLVLADIARTAKRGPLSGGTPLISAENAATVPTAESPFGLAETNTGLTQQNLSPAQIQAIELLRQARQLMKAGRFDEAQAKAEEADQMNVTFPVFADRPDLVFDDLNKKLGKDNVAGRNSPPRNPGVATAGSQQTIPVGPNGKPFAPNTRPNSSIMEASDNHAEGGRQFGNVTQADSITEINPAGSSASELYNRGMAELNRGHRAAAYAAFLAAHQTGQKLDYVRSQRLQDYLRELAPRTQRSGIQLTNNAQIDDNDPAMASGDDQPAPLDAAQQEQMVKFDRLRSDVLNTVFKAERMRGSDPEAALTLIDQTTSKLEGAELPEDSVAPLMKQLNKTRSSLQSEIVRQQPNLDLKKRNEEVKGTLERKVLNDVRIEQEFAKMVEEFNELFKQRRFAEAEIIAKKAKELNPREPVAETLFWKARLASRNASNDQLRLDKEESFFKQLDDVEHAVIVKIGDKNPVNFGDDWADITKRREGKYRTDNRKRGEEELRIEQSLTKRISLHEEQVPLADVVKKIQAVADINIVLDTPGLEEEGINSNIPVSIDVDGIMVKSALNLVLSRYNLAYMVENEVLKITSRMRQQGELVVATYSVADLVIPIPTPADQMVDPFAGLSNPIATGGGQMSIPANAGGQNFAQVGANQNASFDPMHPNARSAGRNNRDPDFNSLSDLITSTIAPDSWDQVGGPASIRAHETTLSLVIRQTQKIHEEIADLLDQLRRLQDLQVTIEVRFVTVADRFFERIGIDFDFNIEPTTGRPNVDNNGQPLQTFGTVNLPQFGLGGQQQQQQGQQGQQAQQGQQQQGAAGLFGAGPTLNLYNNPYSTSVVGMSNSTTFTQDLAVPFQQGSFQVGVPTFGSYNPSAGMEMGLAILSDIEAFFFIQAAQGDQRSNLMFAPKVTVFNGQQGFVTDSKRRPFVTSLTPTVGFGAVGFQPQITTINEGVSLSVTAVVSSDRRYVRLSVTPNFSSITDVFTFSFIGGGQQGGQAGGQQGQNQQGGQGGFGGGQFGVGGGGQQGFGIGGGFGGQQGGQGGQQQQQGGGGGQTITVQQPVVETVTVLTTVSVPDGGTILLGGIKRLKEGRNMSGVPILNKIPYVSRLFKNTGVGRETESLMLMITPRIIIQEEEEELLGLPKT